MNELEKDLENALGKAVTETIRPSPLRPIPSAKNAITSRERIGNTISELESLVADLQTLIATLSAIRERL